MVSIIQKFKNVHNKIQKDRHPINTRTSLAFPISEIPMNKFYFLESTL